MSVIPTFKRGDTFRFLLVVPDDFADGFWVGWTVTSQARTTRGKLIADLEPTWQDPAADTRVLELVNTDTQEWPVGIIEIDVQFVNDTTNEKRSTVTKQIEVVRDVTQP